MSLRKHSEDKYTIEHYNHGKNSSDLKPLHVTHNETVNSHNINETLENEISKDHLKAIHRIKSNETRLIHAEHHNHHKKNFSNFEPSEILDKSNSATSLINSTTLSIFNPNKSLLLNETIIKEKSSVDNALKKVSVASHSKLNETSKIVEYKPAYNDDDYYDYNEEEYYYYSEDEYYYDDYHQHEYSNHNSNKNSNSKANNINNNLNGNIHKSNSNNNRFQNNSSNTNKKNQSQIKLLALNDYGGNDGYYSYNGYDDYNDQNGYGGNDNYNDQNGYGDYDSYDSYGYDQYKSIDDLSYQNYGSNEVLYEGYDSLSNNQGYDARNNIEYNVAPVDYQAMMNRNNKANIYS